MRRADETGEDVVISATRPAPGCESELLTATEALLAGLARTGVRLLVVGGGGATVIDAPDLPTSWRDVALACNDQLEACHAETGVDCAYLSPPALQPSRARSLA